MVLPRAPLVVHLGSWKIHVIYVNLNLCSTVLFVQKRDEMRDKNVSLPMLQQVKRMVWLIIQKHLRQEPYVPCSTTARIPSSEQIIAGKTLEDEILDFV